VRAVPVAVHLVVAELVESDSKTSKQFMIFQFQALRSRRFQRWFHRVNLHHPTLSPYALLYAYTALYRRDFNFKAKFESSYSYCSFKR